MPPQGQQWWNFIKHHSKNIAPYESWQVLSLMMLHPREPPPPHQSYWNLRKRGKMERLPLFKIFKMRQRMDGKYSFDYFHFTSACTSATKLPVNKKLEVSPHSLVLSWCVEQKKQSLSPSQ